MSRLRVKHTTSFTYEAEVQASYNETRMRPDMSDRQFLLSSQLVITPLSEPAPIHGLLGDKGHLDRDSHPASGAFDRRGEPGRD